MATPESKTFAPTVAADPVLLAQANSLIAAAVAAQKNKTLNTTFAVMGVVCTIVEQVANKATTAVSSTDKVQLAISIVGTVNTALYSATPPLISATVYKDVNTAAADTTSLIPIINDVVAVASSAAAIQTVKSCFSCCKK